MNPAYSTNTTVAPAAISAASALASCVGEACIGAAAPEPKVREVERTLTDLRQAISALETHLDVHAGQLQPVLAAQTPCKANGDRSAPSAPLAQVLDECASRVRRLQEYVGDLTARLQL